jgi:hypothetical protein
MNRTVIRNGRETAWLGAGRGAHGSSRVTSVVYRSLPPSRYRARRETLPASYILLACLLAFWLAGLSLDLLLWFQHSWRL